MNKQKKDERSRYQEWDKNGKLMINDLISKNTSRWRIVEG